MPPMNRRDALRTSTALGAAGALGATAGTAPAAASGRAGTGPLRVQVVMFDGVEELDFAAPYEVFAAAGYFTDRPVEVRYTAVAGSGSVTGAYGTRIRGIGPWEPDEADVLVVPGGGYRRPGKPGVATEIARGTLPRALARAVRPGLTIAALCTGVILCAAAGLTRGRPCTTHRGARADLERRGGILKDARVVDDGDLVTAGGVTSGLELALWLTRRELGADPATKLEAMLEYEARGTVWTPGPVRR